MPTLTTPAIDPRRMYGYHTVHQPLQSPEEFGPEHLQQFRELGFVAIENVLTPEEVAISKAAMHDLIAAGDPDIVSYEGRLDGTTLSPEERLVHARRLFRFTASDERLRGIMNSPKLMSICRQLIGSELELYQDMGLMKPANIGSEKPWHQDAAYFLVDAPDKIIGTWIAVDDATPENGCMHFVPGSHLAGPQAHYHDRDCMLPDSDERIAQDVMVPLRAGGAIFFSGLVHHGTPPNNSPISRWALQFHYVAKEAFRLISVEEQGRFFNDRAGAAGCADNNGQRPIATRVLPT